MTDNLSSILRECAEDLLNTEDKVTAEHVVRCAYQRHPQVFIDQQEQMVLTAARRQAASIMRGMSEDEESPQTLPGLGLPSAITVVTPDGNYFVRTDKAVWSQLQAGRNQRVANVNAAQAKLDNYDDGLSLLRPFMEAEPDRTVAEAFSEMHRQQAS